MRPVVVVAVAFLLVATTGWRPASAAENLGLCDSDQNRTTTSDIEAGVEWCFDGERLIVKNESAVVMRIDGGTGLKTSMKTWSSGADAVLREVGESDFFVPDEADVFIPGYQTTIAVGPGETRIGFIADPELTVAYQKAQAKLKLYGLVPGYGDVPQGIDAANSFIGEMDDVVTNYKHCLRQASNWFSEGGCTLGLSGNVLVAVGRAGLAIIPFLNDVPKIVSGISDAVDVGLTADELIVDFSVDLQAYSWRREVIIASTSGGQSAWDRIKGASLPGLCRHDATTLVDGEDVTLDLYSEGWFQISEGDTHEGLDSPAGPLIVTLASCSAGGVAWEPMLVAFTADGQFYAETMFYDADWESVGLDAPGRGGASIELVGGVVVARLPALKAGDAACCPTGEAVVTVAADDGALRSVSISNTAAGDITSGSAPSSGPNCEEQFTLWLDSANSGIDWVGVTSIYGGESIVDLVTSYGPLRTDNLSCRPVGNDLDAPENAEMSALTVHEDGWAIVVYLRQDARGDWVPVGILNVGGGL